MTRPWAHCGLLLSILLVCRLAPAQLAVPEVGRPVCVVAFCPSGSKYPNKQIPCDSDAACLCWDQCGGSGSGSRGASGSGGGGGRLLTAAVVGLAKAAFVIAAPGHATEALSKGPHTSAAEAQSQFRQQQATQAAQAQRGRDLAIEAEALRQFRRAVAAREENPHRYLAPLFSTRDDSPRMNVRDSLQQLRCVQQALQSAEAAVGSGIAGDISFLDARRAVEVASGAWDSGLAPAACGGESLASQRALSQAQRQQILSQLVVGIERQATLQDDLRQQQAQVAQAEAQAQQAKQSLATTQAAQLAPLAQAHTAAQQAVTETRRAVEDQRQAEPPLRSRKAPEPPTSDLMQRLLKAQAEAAAQEEDTRRALEQTQQQQASASQELEKRLAEGRTRAQADLARVEEALRTTRGENQERLSALGLPATPPKP